MTDELGPDGHLTDRDVEEQVPSGGVRQRSDASPRNEHLRAFERAQASGFRHRADDGSGLTRSRRRGPPQGKRERPRKREAREPFGEGSVRWTSHFSGLQTRSERNGSTADTFHSGRHARECSPGHYARSWEVVLLCGGSNDRRVSPHLLGASRPLQDLTVSRLGNSLTYGEGRCMSRRNPCKSRGAEGRVQGPFDALRDACGFGRRGGLLACCGGPTDCCSGRSRPSRPVRRADETRLDA